MPMPKRLVGFSPPGNPATARQTSASSTPVTQAAAPTTTAAADVTRDPTTQAPAVTTPQTTPAQDTQKNTDVLTTTRPVTTPATTQVVAANPSTTAITSTGPAAPSVAAVTSADPNPVVVADPSSTNTQAQQFTVTRVTKTASQSTSSTELPSTSAAADNSPGVGSIAGYAAAALAGIAVISIFAIWMIRRKRRREADADLDAAPFNRQSWLRNSTIINDDVPTPAASNFPPPRRDPEMIDRSFNATPNYAGMNQYPQTQNNFGYATQPSYQPGAVIFSPSSANSSFGPGGGPATPLPFSPAYDPTTPNPFEQQAGYTEVTRGGPQSPFNPYHQQQQFDQMTPSGAHATLPTPEEDLPLSPHDPSPRVEAAPPMLPPVATGGADNIGRVPAYPELSPAPTSAHGHVVEVRASTYEGQTAPVQYGFAEGPQLPAPSTPVIIAAPQPPAALQPAAGRTLTRPETVYDTEDAYGGM